MVKSSSQGPYDSIGRHVNAAARSLRLMLDAKLATEGSNFSTWTILAALDALGGAIQRELAALLGVEGPTLVRQVSQLETNGLVSREPVPGDLRAARIVLTAKGRGQFRRLRSALQAAEAQLTEGLDPDEIETTLRILDQLATRARTLRAG